MCPYYPAKEGLTRLTAAEVTEWESERRRGGKVVVELRRAAKRQLIIPKSKTSRARTSRRRKPALTLAAHLYTTSVCVLRLRHFALLIYGTLQVPWRRCRALQFMSNLVNILSPVRPVTHCFFPSLCYPPHLPSPPPSPVPGWQTEIKCACIPSDSHPFVVCGRHGESLTSELGAR